MNFGISYIGDKKILQAEWNDSTIALSSMYRDDYGMIWAKGHLSSFYHAKYFVYGIGDGSFLRALLELADLDASIIVVEPSKDLYELVQKEFDLSFMSDSRVRLLLAPSVSMIEQTALSMLSYTDIEGAVICAYPNYQRLYPENYAEFYGAVTRAAVQTSFSFEIARRHGALITQNIISNCNVLSKAYPVTALSQIFQSDTPLIIVASGPSLDEELDRLAAVKGHIPILCVDSALPTLMAHNIIPDLFISVDPYKELENFTDERIASTPGIFALSSRYELMTKHKAAMYLYNDKVAFSDCFYQLPTLEVDGSVANNAFGIALACGIKKVIFVGLDLGYPDGKTHSANSKVITQAEDEVIPIASNSGAPLVTNKGMNLYRQLFEQSIVAHPDYEFITTSKDGALIEGASYVGLEASIKDYIDCTFTLSNPNDTTCDANISKTMSNVIAKQENFVKLIGGADLSTLKTLRHTLITSPELQPIYLSSCRESEVLLKTLDKKEGATFELMKYRKYFKIVSDTAKNIIELEQEIIR